jgi:hypothetical protein
MGNEAVLAYAGDITEFARRTKGSRKKPESVWPALWPKFGPVTYRIQFTSVTTYYILVIDRIEDL